MKTDVVEIFQTIRAAMQPYTASGFVAKNNTNTTFDLWCDPTINAPQANKTQNHFAGITIANNGVNFNFTPLITEPEITKALNPDLVSLLKTQSCFVVNVLDNNRLDQIVFALKIGFKIYKQNGWV